MTLKKIYKVSIIDGKGKEKVILLTTDYKEAVKSKHTIKNKIDVSFGHEIFIEKIEARFSTFISMRNHL